MLGRRGGLVGGQVVDRVGGEHPVLHVEGRRDDLPVVHLPRRHGQPGGDGDGGGREHEVGGGSSRLARRAQNRGQRDRAAARGLAQQVRGDEEPGDHEEDVDTDVPAGQSPRPQVVEHHQQNRDRAQRRDLGPVSLGRDGGGHCLHDTGGYWGFRNTSSMEGILPSMEDSSPRPRTIALTAVPPVVWGSTYAVSQLWLPAERPFFAAAARVLPAGLLLLRVGAPSPAGSLVGTVAGAGRPEPRPVLRPALRGGVPPAERARVDDHRAVTPRRHGGRPSWSSASGSRASPCSPPSSGSPGWSPSCGRATGPAPSTSSGWRPPSGPWCRRPWASRWSSGGRRPTTCSSPRRGSWSPVACCSCPSPPWPRARHPRST